MIRPGRLSILILLLLISAMACIETGSPADPEAQRLQRLVEQLRAEHEIPGLSVAIASGSGPVITAAAGLADLDRGTPVTTETMFFLGSVAKNLFATVALQLADQGRLDLDSPLSDHLPWPRGDEIRVRMLLNHTSGIPDYLTGELFEPADDGGIPLFFRSPRPPEALITAIPDRAPVFIPGSRQDYSNTNGLLVGEVIRKVTGQSLAEVFDQQIVSPIGLQRMYLYGASSTHRPRARGYSAAGYWGAAEGDLADCSAADEALPDAADGSVVAAAGDLLRYHQALRGGELLSRDSWAAMRTVQPGIHNGLGYLVSEGPFGRVEGNLGRSMGHVAANLHYLDLDAYVVILSNRSDVPLPLQPLLETWFARE